MFKLCQWQLLPRKQLLGVKYWDQGGFKPTDVIIVPLPLEHLTIPSDHERKQSSATLISASFFSPTSRKHLQAFSSTGFPILFTSFTTLNPGITFFPVANCLAQLHHVDNAQSFRRESHQSPQEYPQHQEE